MLAVLRRRDFLLLWLGGLISVAGDWVLIAALPYFVYQETGSTIATAAMIAAELAPSVLLGSIAGVFVDRWHRKRVLVIGNLLQALAVSLLVMSPGGDWLWLVYVVATAQSTVAAFTGPAEAALLPTLVGPDQLLPANALNVFNNRLGRLLGLPVGGLLLGSLGLPVVVAVDVASFLLAALLIAFVRVTRTVRPPAAVGGGVRSAWREFWSEWAEGMSVVRRERTIAMLFVVFGLMTFGGTMLDPLTVAWARDSLHAGPEIYALLSTAHAASGIVGTLLVGRFAARLAPRDLIGWASIAAGILLVVKYNVPSIPLAFALSFLGGATSASSAVGVETLAQQTVRDEYRGRVFGSLNATLALLSLSGAATGGILAESVGVIPMLDAAAALTILAGAIVLRAFAARPGPIRELSR